MNLSETLLRSKAKAAARHICEGGDAEGFEQLWAAGGESAALAILHDAGACVAPDNRRLAAMTYTEKAELRDNIGDEAFLQRVKEESK